MDEPVWVPPHERPPLVASARMLQPLPSRSSARRLSAAPESGLVSTRLGVLSGRAFPTPAHAKSNRHETDRSQQPRFEGRLGGGAPGRPLRPGDPVTGLDRVVPRRYDARTNMRRDGNVRPSSVMNGAEYSSTWERTASRSSSGRPLTMIASGPAISVLTSQYR